MTRQRLIDHLLHVSRHRYSAVCFLVVLPFAFFWRETLGWRLLGDQDAVFWFLPAYHQVAEQLRSFHFPLWNQYAFGGMPLFAAWQAGVLDPLNWLYLVFGTSSRALTLVQELSFAIAGLSLFAYARSIGLSRRGSVFAAVIYAFGGYPVARTLYPGLLHVTALAPLVLFFIERSFQEVGTRRAWRMSVVGALVVSWQVFAAHPQPLIYSLMLAAAYAVFRGFGGGLSQPEFRLKFLGHCGLILGGGLCLAGVQLLPAFEFANDSVRQSWSYDMFTRHSLHPLSLAGAVIPFLHGGGRGIYHLPYWGPYWHHNEAQIYVGALSLSLAFAGAVGAWRERNRIGIFWSCAAVVGLVLALGKYSGPIAWMLYRVPVLNSFRSPNRYWMVVALAVALLAGYAVDWFLRRENGVLGRIALVSSACLTLLVGLAATFGTLWRDRTESLIRSAPDLADLPNGFLNKAGMELWIPVVCVMLSTLMIGLFAGSRWVGRRYWILLALLVIDFNLYAAFAPNSVPNLVARLGQALPSSLAAHSQVEPHRAHLVINPAAGEFSPFLFYGHEMASGYDPLLSSRYRHFTGIDEAGRSNLASMLADEDRTLDLLNVRYILVAPQIIGPQAVEGGLENGYRNQLDGSRRWRKLEARSPVAHFQDYTIFENGNVLPRAWLVRGFRVLASEDQLKPIRGETPGFDPTEVALLDPGEAAGLSEFPSVGLPAAGVERVTINERQAGRIVLDVETKNAAILVLSEIFAPGWKAQVDGQVARIRRVDYLLRGVALGEGRHRVEVVYSPDSVKLGAVLTLVAMLGMAGVLFTTSSRWTKR